MTSGDRAPRDSVAQDKDIVILGAGIVGACSALELLARGFRVTIVDKGELTRGASYGNAGTISPCSCVPVSMPGAWANVPKWLLDPNGPLAVRPAYLPRFIPWGVKFLLNGNRKTVLRISDAMATLARGNTDIYAAHLSGTGYEYLLRPSYYILAYRDPRAVSTGNFDYKLRLKAGARMEIADARRLHEIEPSLSKDFKAALVMHGQSRAFSPGELRDALIAKAAGMGAVLRKGTARAIKPRPDGNWTVETENGAIISTRLLLTAGAGSRALLKPIGINVPLEHEYGHHVELLNANVAINNTVMDTDTKVVTSSMKRGVRVSGFADFGGPDASHYKSRAKVLIRHAKAMFPSLETGEYSEWSGPRPSFPDSLPAIGAVAGHRNMFVAFGHSHFGFGMAPRTGQLIGRVIAGEDPDADMTPYALSRFLRSGKPV